MELNSISSSLFGDSDEPIDGEAAAVKYCKSDEHEECNIS
jgi:hypothetical protein